MARPEPKPPAIKRYEETGFFYALDEQQNAHLIRELTAYISDAELGWRQGRKKYVTTKGEPVMVEPDGQCRVIPTGQILTKA